MSNEDYGNEGRKEMFTKVRGRNNFRRNYGGTSTSNLLNNQKRVVSKYVVKNKGNLVNETRNMEKEINENMVKESTKGDMTGNNTERPPSLEKIWKVNKETVNEIRKSANKYVTTNDVFHDDRIMVDCIVYASNNGVERRKLCKEMEGHKLFVGLHPRAILGDFNDAKPVQPVDGSLFINKINMKDADTMIRDVTNDEIKEAIFDIDSNKVSRSTVFSSKFFKIAWKFIKEREKQELLEILLFKCGKLPVRYLGVPFLAKRLAQGKAKVAWKVVCWPKDQGGLVFYDKWCSCGPSSGFINKRTIYDARIDDDLMIADMVVDNRWSQLIPKHAFILWLAVQEKILTQDRMEKWKNSADLKKETKGFLGMKAGQRKLCAILSQTK
uniref:RNA-directed DNA polymerase, eukaryota, reverse transcriptase zinc-binding domain protein n=1 Tax=Tanacetum cinerariifolium TaxID=118510 RepID=A0A699GTX3_TANCI|nr:hypothetical protein [Tanacetum cinerariifolium]